MGKKSGVGISVQFSRSVVSDSLRPHELQHARPPCPSPAPRFHSDSRPSSQWCHPAISSSVVPFSSCPQSLPASEYFPRRQLFAWGGQSTAALALASFLPKKSQGWSPSEWTKCRMDQICISCISYIDSWILYHWCQLGSPMSKCTYKMCFVFFFLFFVCLFVLFCPHVFLHQELPWWLRW